MSIYDETWNRPVCQFCNKAMAYGKIAEHYMCCDPQKKKEGALHNLITSLSEPYNIICDKLGSYEDFYICVGGIGHHEYKGGLLTHTLEVARYCEEFLKIKPEANRDILITAALWHDLGKIWEYKRPKAVTIKTEKANLFHHTYTSLAEFTVAAKECKLNQINIDNIGHAIISHHYYAPQRNHPILPQTLEALLLCNADHLSAMFGETKEHG